MGENGNNNVVSMSAWRLLKKTASMSAAERGNITGEIDALQDVIHELLELEMEEGWSVSVEELVERANRRLANQRGEV